MGAGSFGTAIANLLAENASVYLYARSKDAVAEMLDKSKNKTQTLHENVIPTNDIQEITEKCYLLFPVVPSAQFREMIKSIQDLLRPDHILIHGTKGLDQIDYDNFSLSSIKTMSQVITEESSVVRVGCLAGPNLAGEIAKKQPAATVLASRFNEVIEQGSKMLSSQRFRVYGSSDLRGVELAGIFKNYIAIAAGACAGLGFGENARSLLTTRGMAEMIYMGKALGVSPKAFLGLAGIGDLMATCTSPLSRNFTVGRRLSLGEKLDDILATMGEVAEGVKTTKIVNRLSEHFGVKAPIAHTLHRIMYEGLDMKTGVEYLMRYPAYTDADYIED